MKITFYIVMSCLLYHNMFGQTLHSITDVNGNTISIDSLGGRKLLVIVLPLQNDTATTNQLLRFQNKYGQKVKVVGIVANPSGNISIDTYQPISNAGMIVTEGVQAADTASERESVLGWLTQKSNNRQIDKFATGSKYFLSEDGRLYAQLGKEMSLDDRIIKNIVNTVVPRRALPIQQKSTRSSSVSTTSNTQ